MGKRRYRSVEFKSVSWDQVREQSGGGRVVVAIDVAKEDFVAAVLDGQQRVLVTFGWRHPTETRAVVDAVSGLARGLQVEVAMEPSGTYGDALVWQLGQAEIPLYRVSPKRVHDAAEIYDGVPSLHDAKAAYLIGRLHLEGVSSVWQPASAERRTVSALLTTLTIDKERQQATQNRLEAHLSRHWPEILGLLELDGASLPTLIAAYGDPAGVAADPEGASDLLRKTGRAGLQEDKIQAVIASAMHSVGVPCLAAERALLQWLASDLCHLHKQVQKSERTIGAQVDDSPVLRRLSRVIGKVSAAVLLAALGSPEDYPDAASYVKALGLNLKERSSGKHKGQLKLTKRGPAIARFYLYFAALRLIVRDPLIKRWYRAKTDHPQALKNKTVIALMRKLAKALWHLARGGTFAADKLVNLDAVGGA